MTTDQEKCHYNMGAAVQVHELRNMVLTPKTTMFCSGIDRKIKHDHLQQNSPQNTFVTGISYDKW